MTLTPSDAAKFMAKAEDMRRQAVAAGDQSYGAVVVKNGKIVGLGPSRVITRTSTQLFDQRVTGKPSVRGNTHRGRIAVVESCGVDIDSNHLPVDRKPVYKAVCPGKLGPDCDHKVGFS